MATYAVLPCSSLIRNLSDLCCKYGSVASTVAEECQAKVALSKPTLPICIKRKFFSKIMLSSLSKSGSHGQGSQRCLQFSQHSICGEKAYPSCAGNNSGHLHERKLTHQLHRTALCLNHVLVFIDIWFAEDKYCNCKCPTMLSDATNIKE